MAKVFQGKTKETEEEIERFLDIVSQSALVFNEGVKEYIQGKMDRLEKRALEISDIEREADDRLMSIKYNLYTYMLIPDSRADVLKLLDDMDDIVDTTKQVLLQLSIEKPDSPTFLHENILEITDSTLSAINELIRGVRSFFHNPKMVGDYANKVYFYEKEVDTLEEKAIRKVFESEEIARLSAKMHIRFFIEKIALLSDEAEEIAKDLLIYSAKREI